MEIHQFIESFSDADAIGYHALGIQRFLKKNNIKSNIYANNFDEKMANKCFHFSEFKNNGHEKDTKIIHHHSIYSLAFEHLIHLPYQKILYFHNITPPEFFNYKPKFKKLLTKGYNQLKKFNKVFTMAAAASKYNIKTLNNFNFQKKITIIPPFVNLEEKFWPFICNKKPSEKTKIIFVGKIAPHKKQTELIKVFNAYQEYFNQQSELYIVGSFHPDDNYHQKVNQLAGNNPHIVLTGRVPLKELVYHYQTADLFLCLSEHEGFGIPIIESMFFKLPIIAYSAAAVPETLGKGGILINTKDPLAVSATINKLITDNSLKKQIVANQTKELKKYKPVKIESKLEKWLIKN